MRRCLAGVFCLLVIACQGCASSGFGFGKSGAFAKGEQWEPEIEEVEAKSSEKPSEWSSLRKGKSKSEDPVDKFLWSDEARDINRSLGGGF